MDTVHAVELEHIGDGYPIQNLCVIVDPKALEQMDLIFHSRTEGEPGSSVGRALDLRLNACRLNSGN